MRTRNIAVPVVAGAALVGGVLTVRSATAATDHGESWPKAVAAPYIDVDASPRADLAGMKNAGASRYLTLSFVTDPSGECNVAWGSGTALDSARWKKQVHNLRAQGGEVAVSVGGQTGTDPATSCGNVAALQAQYQRIVDAFSLTHLDLDVEGSALANSPATDRRNAAVAGLQKANPSLSVSYTLPVTATGLTDTGRGLLDNAHEHGVKPDIVNGMAMNYGSPTHDTGAAAMSAGAALKGQIRVAYPAMSDAEAWSTVGVTPMIGHNDSAGEVFTLHDAGKLVAWAKRNHVGRLGYWSTARDAGSCAGQATASTSCGGVKQEAGAFGKIFATFNP